MRKSPFPHVQAAPVTVPVAGLRPACCRYAGLALGVMFLSAAPLSTAWAQQEDATSEDVAEDADDPTDALLDAPPPVETAPSEDRLSVEGEEVERQLTESVEEGEEMEEATARRITEQDIGEDVLEEFVLSRGFYVASDLGVFFTLGGARGYSNTAPYLAVKLGYDIGDYFGIQANFSTGYSSGNPVGAQDWPVGDPRGTNNFDATRDYGLFNAGLQLVGAVRPTQRFAIEPHVGGGYTFVDPPISQPGSSANNVAKYSGHAGHVVAGFDLKYLTLLTGFTAGLSFNFYGIIGEGGAYFIPSLAVGAVVRYTPVSYDGEG